MRKCVAFGMAYIGLLLMISACSQDGTLTSPAPVPTAQALHNDHAAGASHGMSAGDKGYIDGWFNGKTVKLYDTKSFSCAEPPESGASTGCELGAAGETPPRPGQIPTIYAIAAVGGIQPDLLTLACVVGTPCLNHPAMIDASRVGGPVNGPALSHSHILDQRGGGWFNTVNIRVRDINAWKRHRAGQVAGKGARAAGRSECWRERARQPGHADEYLFLHRILAVAAALHPLVAHDRHSAQLMATSRL